MKLNLSWAKLGFRVSLISSLIFASATFIAPANAVEGATCDGLEATIVSSDRVIYGASGVDVIVVQGEGGH